VPARQGNLGSGESNPRDAQNYQHCPRYYQHYQHWTASWRKNAPRRLLPIPAEEARGGDGEYSPLALLPRTGNAPRARRHAQPLPSSLRHAPARFSQYEEEQLGGDLRGPALAGWPRPRPREAGPHSLLDLRLDRCSRCPRQAAQSPRASGSARAYLAQRACHTRFLYRSCQGLQ
jgi:hypothetical protein